MDRDGILAVIDRFWRARIAGDKAELLSFVAPDGVYEMVGARSFAAPAVVGPAASFGSAADQLVSDFKFHRVERLTAFVEGAKAAIVNRIEVSFRGAAPFTTEVCDLWEFDGAGKAKSLRQFVDTALIRDVMQGRT
jgi:ketosteroid isomerase-like protein